MNKNTKWIILSYVLVLIITVFTLISMTTGIYNYEHRNGDYTQTEDYLRDSFYFAIADAAQDMIYNKSNGMITNVVDGNRIIYSDKVDYNLNNLKYVVYYKDLVITNVELSDKNASKEGIEKSVNSNITNDEMKSYRFKDGFIETNSESLKDTVINAENYFKFSYLKLVPETGEVDENQRIETKLNDFEIFATFDEKINNYYGDLYQKFAMFGENAVIICPLGFIIDILLISVICILTGKNDNDELEVKLTFFDRLKLELAIIIELILITVACTLFVLFADSLNNYKIVNIKCLVGATLIGYLSFAIFLDTIIKRIKTHTLVKNTIMYKIYRFLMDIIKVIKIYLENNYSKSTARIIYYFILLCIALFLIGTFGLMGMIIVVVIVFGLVYSMMKKSNEIQEDAKEAKMKNERLKAELITNVSHDIKTPLTSIINYIDLLKKENLDNEKAKEYIAILDEKSQRLKKLTEDLIEVSKATSGNIKLNLESIDIVEFINQLVGEFKDRFEKKKLDVVVKGKNKQIFVECDSRYMFRIVENIFSNIEKYALESTRVYIDIEETDNTVKILFKNTSKEKLNIPEEELMQRFVRGNKSRSTEGSGLGLAIVSSLTEAHNGIYDLKIDGDLFKISLTFKK